MYITTNSGADRLGATVTVVEDRCVGRRFTATTHTWAAETATIRYEDAAQGDVESPLGRWTWTQRARGCCGRQVCFDGGLDEQ